MREWFKEFVQAVRGPTREQIQQVTSLLNQGAPMPEPASLGLDDINVGKYIHINGFPRIVTYGSERCDN